MEQEELVKRLNEMRSPAGRKKLLDSRDNFVVVTLGYGDGIVIQRKNFLKFCEALEGAEIFEGSFGNYRISPLKSDTLKAMFMSETTYLNHKMAALLDVTVGEIERTESVAQDIPF